MKTWNYLQETSGSPLSTEIMKQTHKIIMEHRDGKDVLEGEYRKSPVFAGYHIFAPAVLIEIHMEGGIFRIHETRSSYGRYKFVWKHYQYPSI